MCVDLAVLLAMHHQSTVDTGFSRPLTSESLCIPLLGGAAFEQVRGRKEPRARKTAGHSEASAIEPCSEQQILEFNLVVDASDEPYDGTS